MQDAGRLDEALALLEEQFPGISSPEFEPTNAIELGVQFQVAVYLLMSGSDRENVVNVDVVFKRIEQQYATWEGLSGLEAAVRYVYGDVEDAIRLTLEDLDDRQGWLYVWDWPVRYGHIGVYRRLAREPAVAVRIKELQHEATRAGRDILAYIEKHDLQL